MRIRFIQAIAFITIESKIVNGQVEVIERKNLVTYGQLLPVKSITDNPNGCYDVEFENGTIALNLCSNIIEKMDEQGHYSPVSQGCNGCGK